MAVYAQFGFNLPHGTASLLNVGSSVSYDDIQLGDIIITSSSGSQTGRHTGIYAGNGKWVNAKGVNYGTVINDVPTGKILSIRRVVGVVDGGNGNPSIYPDDQIGGGAGQRGEIDEGTVNLDGLTFEFNGNPQKMELNETETKNPWIFSKLSQIIDYILGIFTGAIRVSLVGWTAIFENWISSAIHLLSGTNDDTIYTVEDIIFNRIPIFDVNIFSNTAGGQEVTETSAVGVIRNIVSTWYVSVRNIVAIVLMIILIYTGIRLAISTVAEEKANYKQYLIGWIKSIVLLFVIHYILMIILNLNSTLVGIFSGDSSQENLIYETIRTRAYDIRFSVGMTGMFMYIALIFMLIKFVWVYAKRFFTIIILTIISPIVVGKYAYDSASGKKSLAFSNFLYLYSSNILIQAAHALIYVSLVSIALDLALESITGFILALIFMNFMLKADQIVLKLFKFDKDIGDIRTPFNKKKDLAGVYYAYGTYKLAKNMAKGGVRTIKHAGSSGVKAIGNRFGKEDIGGEFKDSINKKKNKIDRYLLTKSDEYLGKDSELSQKLALKIASRRKGTSGRLAKISLKLRKVERKQRYTSNFKYIASEIKGVGSVILAVPTMAFSPSIGVGLAASGISTIKKNGKQEKLRHWTTKQKIANAVTLGHYGNRIEAKEKIEKNKKELDALVFSVMKSNEAMNNVENELDKFTDPVDRQKAKETMKQVINMKAEVNKIKKYIDKYLDKNSITDIKSMSNFEMQKMASEVSYNIGKDSNLSKDKIDDITNEVIKTLNRVNISDSNRFAEIINESAVTATVDNKFIDIAQQINKMKEAEISTKNAAEDATGDDDTELININRFIDNL